MGTFLQPNLLYNMCQFEQVLPWAEIPYAGTLVLSHGLSELDDSKFGGNLVENIFSNVFI